ncbi:hypothetical protein G9A89_001661 [Geosiphon pyriformis]|nr:hypothetical protein G9A89_001661 [Geosiphon pyriformis]
MAPREKSYVEVGERRGQKPVKIYYEIHGTGPNKILFIMGYTTSCASWDYQVKHFGAHKDFQICIFDNRGVGWSDSPIGLYSTTQMSQDTIELLDQLGWTENIHVVGVSMGGMIAQEMAHAKPNYFRSLCLTSTAAGRSLPPLIGVTTLTKLLFIRDQSQKIPIVSELLFPKLWLDSPTAANSSHSTNRELIDELLRERITRTRTGISLKKGDTILYKILEAMLIRSTPLKILSTLQGNLGQLAACIKHNVSLDRLASIRKFIPQILVITGTQDNLVRPTNSFFLRDHLNADFEIFEGCGHALPSEQAERYNNTLENHFRKAGLIEANLES